MNLDVKSLIAPLDERYATYLSDESQKIGSADSISFPKNIEESSNIIKFLSENSIPITVQGGRTGICACSVPTRGHVLNLSKINDIQELEETERGSVIKVEAGANLQDLEQILDREGLFWPPNSSEHTATVGGVIATNARGIDADYYGSNRNYIEEICFLDKSGQLFQVKRGDDVVKQLSIYDETEALNVFDKQEWGFSNQEEVIDLMVGSEGMYGVIVSTKLNVIDKPKVHWGIVFFFDYHEPLYQFAESITKISSEKYSANITVVEYLDELTISYIEEAKKVNSELNSLPGLGEDTLGVIYLEIQGENESDIEEMGETLIELAADCGSDIDRTWAASEVKDIERIRKLRHAAPEVINMKISQQKQLDNRITKLSTDMSIKGLNFGDVVSTYKEGLRESNLLGTVFGHVLNNRLHVNIIPKNYQDYVKGKKLIEKWAVTFKEECSVKLFDEHGIGKIKKELFKTVSSDKQVKELQHFKEQWDPDKFWNPDNIFDY